MFLAVFDMIVRETILAIRYYHVNANGMKPSGRMVFCADGKFAHGGMFDRLKGAISVYAAAKVLGRNFRINFTSPFQLEKYLEPNEYDWRVKDGEYEENVLTSKLVFMYGECDNPYRLLKKRKRDAHFYYGFDSLDYINQKCGTSFVWGDLYRELFKPSAYLQKFIDREKDKIGTDYVAIHLRFMNLLGDQMEFDCDPTLPVADQDKLKELMLNEVKNIAGCHKDKKVLLATDSKNFTDYAVGQIPGLYMIPGDIMHIGTTEETSDEANIKLFLDYYMIAGAKKVYNIVGFGMWKSAFPEYAAKIGETEFERIVLLYDEE